MKTYLLSVSSAALLLVLLELMISEGKTKKYISGFLRLTMIIALIAPMLQLFQTNITTQEFFISDDVREEAILEPDSLYVSTLEMRIKADLEKNGGEFEVKIDMQNDTIEAVKIKCKKQIINEAGKNIYTIEKIKEKVIKIVNVKKEKIIVYGAE